MNRHRLHFLPVLVAALLAGASRGDAWSSNFDTQEGSGLSVRVSRAFESFPSAGFMPCRVMIENGMARDGRWDMTFTTRAGAFSRQDQQVLRRSFSVPAGRKMEFDVLMPVCVSSSGGYTSPQVSISGPGIVSPLISLPGSNSPGSRKAPFVLMSARLHADSWGRLRAALDKEQKISLLGGEIDLGVLGEDWRGLLGVDALFLTVEDYAAQPPARRAAIRNWIAQGGSLVLCGEGVAPDFGGLPADGAPVVHAMGTVRRLVPTQGEAFESDAMKWITDLHADLAGPLAESLPRWRLAGSLGPAGGSVAFLAAFITLFAVTVGPLNLFWFAGPTRRHRLFWTTPLISLAASVLLGAVIVVQDGFGGTGARMVLRYLQPDEKQEIVKQEQASRTGLLLSRSFEIDEAVFLSPLTVPKTLRPAEGSLVFRQGDGGRFSGDWFASRAVQGQFAAAIVPTREAIEILPGTDGVPQVRSSIAAELREIVYLDARGHAWRAENVRAGQTVPLAPTEHRNRLIDEAVAQAGPMLRRSLGKIRGRPGCFYAVASEGPCVETLPSIRWNSERIIYAGPVVLAP